MVDFGDIKKLADQHDDKVDAGIDKVGDAAGQRFGHDEQIDKLAQRAKDATGAHEDAPAEGAPTEGEAPQQS